MQQSLRTIALVALLALSSHAYGLICDAGCNGTDINNPVNCYYCPTQCGNCSDVGVITTCFQPGTAHFGFGGGPISSTTQVLDILLQKAVKASFFLVGAQVSSFPGAVQRMVDEGHYLASNSYSLVHANALSDEDLQTVFRQELNKTRVVIQQIVSAKYTPAQVPIIHYRPPYGELNNYVLAAVKQLNYMPVMWNLDMNDWTGNATLMNSLLSSTLNRLNPQADSIVLSYQASNDVGLSMLPTLIDQIRSAGYRFVTAQECYGAPALLPTNGTWSSTGVNGLSGASSGNTGGMSGSAASTGHGAFPSPAAAATPTASVQMLLSLTVAIIGVLAWAF